MLNPIDMLSEEDLAEAIRLLREELAARDPRVDLSYDVCLSTLLDLEREKTNRILRPHFH